MTMTRNRLIVIAAGSSAVLLIVVFIFQRLGYAPCELCLLQRWPHRAAVVIGVLALATGWRWLPWAGAAAAATTGTIGVYHAGVEQHWWAGPDACTRSGDLAGSTKALLDQIMAAPLVRCDEIAWAFAGLSMAAWNAVLSLALALIWIAAARRT